MRRRTGITSTGQVAVRRGKSPFAKYRGIGNPGIPSGRKAIVKKIRELRGR